MPDLEEDGSLTPLTLSDETWHAARAYLARRCPDPQDYDTLADMLGLTDR